VIQNLRFVFSHQDIVILSAIFIIILFLIFPIKKYNLSIAYRIIAACSLWWILLVFIYPPKGYNYEIYSHNASLTLNGQDAFGREAKSLSSKEEASPEDKSYLDYTGAQHLVYVLLESLNLSEISENLYGLGYQCWTIINITIILLLIFFFNQSSQDEVEANKIWPIIILSFCPIIPFYNIISFWEDKLIFLLLPLLLLFLIQSKRYKTASFLVGIIIAYNGLVVFFLPIYLIYLFREAKRNVLLDIALIAAGIIITMIPFFPESLSGWSNRINRVNASFTFRFSIYSFLPEGLYSSLFNNALIFIISCTTIVLYFFKKINLLDSLIISLFLVIVFSPFNGVPRVIPLMMLLAILSPNMNRYNWLSLVIFLYAFLLFDSGYITPVFNTVNTILLYIPILFSIILYIYKRIKYGNNIIL